jgi:hypothetical protein
MFSRPPLSLPRLSIAGPRPGRASLRPSRPSAATLAHCATPRRPARRKHGQADPQPGFDPWARRPIAQVLRQAAARSRIGRQLRQGARRLACLQPGSEPMNLLIASLIRILALTIAIGLHGLLALTALG